MGGSQAWASRSVLEGSAAVHEVLDGSSVPRALRQSSIERPNSRNRVAAAALLLLAPPPRDSDVRLERSTRAAALERGRDVWKGECSSAYEDACAGSQQSKRVRGNEHGPHFTALFTSAAILFSSAAVSSISAKDVGHMPPSSRFAWSLKPNVAYLDLNL
jgi:hypothetical protein